MPAKRPYQAPVISELGQLDANQMADKDHVWDHVKKKLATAKLAPERGGVRNNREPEAVAGEE